MTAHNDLDQALGAWFGAEAAPAVPPEPLARVIASTRGQRPRHSLVAGIGSHSVGAGPTSGIQSLAASHRRELVIVLVALLTAALAAGALLVGGRLVAPPNPLLRTYLNELVAAHDLPAPMFRPVLVPLDDGRVLAIGGSSDESTITASVYDPATGASAVAGPMVADGPSSISSAVRLKDGRVLIVGETVIQVFDPTSMRFTPVGPTSRSGGAAALLGDGRVLLTGGYSPIDQSPVLQAELFDPKTLSFSPTGSVGIADPGRTTTLPDGRVFLAEGPGDHPEIYDPLTGTFSAASTMSGVGGDPLTLPDGRVVLVSGSGAWSRGTIETWDPAGGTVSWISLPEPLIDATPLDDGRVLLIGMCRGRASGWTGIFDPTTTVVTPGPTTKACSPMSTRLADGRVLIAGGDIGDLVAAPTVQIYR